MPVSRGPRSALSAAAVAAVLLAGATGCGDKDGAAPAAAAVPASGSASAEVSASASASVSASASPSAPASSPTGPSASAAPTTAVARTVTPPPAPTRLTVAVDTRGGRLALVRGGAPQEFTVTLRNGNSAEYRHLLVAFQMEMLVGEAEGRDGQRAGFPAGALRPGLGQLATGRLPYRQRRQAAVPVLGWRPARPRGRPHRALPAARHGGRAHGQQPGGGVLHRHGCRRSGRGPCGPRAQHPLSTVPVIGMWSR